jgi:hypothetical protein
MEPDGQPSISFDIDREQTLQRLFWSLLLCELTLVFCDYFIHFQEFVTEIGAIKRIFNLAREDSLGNWFGSVQLLFVAITLWLVYATVRRSRAGSWRKLSWALLATFFSYMAVDDGARLHERLGTAFKELFEGAGWFDAYPSYPWQVVLAPLLIGGTLLLVDTFRNGLTERKARVLLAAGLGMFVLAVGIDVLEGVPEYGPEGALQALSDDGDYALRHYVKVAEEFLELLGATCFLVAFLRQLTAEAAEFRFRFK